MLDLQNDGVLMLWKLKCSILTPVINVFLPSFFVDDLPMATWTMQYHKRTEW